MMSLFNFGFSSKKKNDKGGKENVEDGPSSDIQSENVDQAPAAPGDVAIGSGASASGDPGRRGPVMNESDGDPTNIRPIFWDFKFRPTVNHMQFLYNGTLLM